jgi:hypothetical protein
VVCLIVLKNAPKVNSELVFQHSLKKYIASIEYDVYDRLGQLCDAICMPQGYVLLEKRIVDVALRYGQGSTAPVDRLTRRWAAFFEIKRQIEASIGGSIYNLLPGVVENTFSSAF